MGENIIGFVHVHLVEPAPTERVPYLVLRFGKNHSHLLDESHGLLLRLRINPLARSGLIALLKRDDQKVATNETFATHPHQYPLEQNQGTTLESRINHRQVKL